MVYIHVNIFSPAPLFLNIIPSFKDSGVNHNFIKIEMLK